MIETYYDNLMNSKDMTIRLFSNYDPGLSTGDKPVNSELHEILRFPMTEMYNVNVIHSYKGLTSGISGVFYTIKNAWQKARDTSWSNMLSDYSKVIDAIQAVSDQNRASVNEFEDQFKSSGQTVIRHPISVSDYFKAFNGTTVQIPLNFSIKLYSYYSKLLGKIVTPDEQLRTVSDYFVGKQIGSVTDRMTNYGAPNGFQEFGSYTGAMTQTGFSIRFGRRLEISRLLISNFTFSPSKEFETIRGGAKTRLYYNISFNLLPIYAITVLDIIKMFGGIGLSDITTVNNTFTDNL